MSSKLPTIVPQVIDGVEVNAINARELWENLEVKTPFSMWIQRKIDDSMFVEGQDFISINKNVKRGVGGTVQHDYIISLEMAKHLAMMEKTGRAFEVRQYFIDAEKKLRQIAVKAPVRLTPAEMLLQQAQLMLEMERKTSELDKRVVQLEAKNERDGEYYALTGYSLLLGIPALRVLTKGVFRMLRRDNILYILDIYLQSDYYSDTKSDNDFVVSLRFLS